MAGHLAAWGTLNSLTELVRYLAWWGMGTLMAAGIGWYGGPVALDAYREWQRAGPPPRRYWSQGDVAREARIGVRQIELFLSDREERHDSPG
jgi:hypothetical protein